MRGRALASWKRVEVARQAGFVAQGEDGVTHNLSLAARLADTAWLMARGAVLATGTPRDVLTSEALTSAYQWPVDVTQHRGPDDIALPLVIPSVAESARNA